MIVGVGVDIVDLARFERATLRTPGLIDRLFAPSEHRERSLPLRSLAGRFAAKEALIKVFGDAPGFRWHDIRIVSDDHGSPSFELHGAMKQLAAARRIGSLHLSLSHDAGAAIAFVVADSAIGADS